MHIEITCKIDGEEQIVESITLDRNDYTHNFSIMVRPQPQTITLADYIATASDRGQTDKEAEADFKESACQNIDIIEMWGPISGWTAKSNCAPRFELRDNQYRLPYTNGKLPSYDILSMPGYHWGPLGLCATRNMGLWAIQQKKGNMLIAVESRSKPEAAHAWNNEARKQEGK